MSAEITRYVLVDENDVEGDEEYVTEGAAITQARYRGLNYAVIERTYTYDDSRLVWTPDGSDIWPPAKDVLAEELVKIASIGFDRPGQAAEAAARIRAIVEGEVDAGN